MHVAVRIPRLLQLALASLLPWACSSPESVPEVHRVPPPTERATEEPVPPSREPLDVGVRAPELSAPFRVASYNINFSTRNLDRVVQLIEETDADIVALQETTPAASKTLERRTRTAFPHSHFAPAQWAGGHAIVSRVPLTNVERVEPVHGPFGALVAVAELAGVPTQIVSVHLKPTLPSRGTSSVAVAVAFLENETIRVSEVEQILSRLDPEVPHLIVGDFNTLSSLSVVSRLKTAGYVDSQAHDPRHRNDPTWHWTWDGNPIELRIDYIFHSAEARTQSVRVIDRGPSDHYPVVATLAWAREVGRP
ncbi:MAG: endonuclease/exonuclease/phosphatase family protein [Myxococcota bacterium]